MATVGTASPLPRIRLRPFTDRDTSDTGGGRPLHGPLVFTALVMAALVIVSAIGMLVDDREILHESVWLKPAKFGVAFAAYTVTLAWVLSLPHRGHRVTWWLGTIFATAGVVDVGFIALQAARGTFSHFNDSDDPVNRIGQQVFVSGVPGLFLTTVLIAAVVSFQRLADPAVRTALKSGIWLAVAGMGLGYLMGFTGPQLVRQADGTVIGLVAGHTVRPGATADQARDGVGAMPLTHWSTTGGDLRIPHFVGLHGLQVLLILAVALAALARRYRWLRAERIRTALVAVAAGGYAGALALLLWQALRGQPLTAPDTATLLAWSTLVTTVLGAAAVVLAHARRAARDAG
ncbi:hypothetical protein ACWEQ0_17030 [Nocardia thailandica]